MESDGALALEQETMHVQLGGDTYEVVPQPMPYLNHVLGPVFTELSDVDVEKEGVGAFITTNSYKLLQVFIPDLMPKHLWDGYRSEAEAEAGGPPDFAHARRVSPTGPQVRTAFKVVLKVNGMDLVTQLGKLVDPLVLRSQVTKLLVRLTDQTLSSGRSLPTSSSASTPESPSATSSTPSSRTDPQTEGDEDSGSPSPGSSLS